MLQPLTITSISYPFIRIIYVAVAEGSKESGKKLGTENEWGGVPGWLHCQSMQLLILGCEFDPHIRCKDCLEVVFGASGRLS